MRFILKFNFLFLCLVAALTFNSCSSDDDGDNGDNNTTSGTAELPSNALGEYFGAAFLENGDVIPDVFATITETSSRTYTVSISASTNIPAIEDITFVTAPDNEVVFASINTGFIVGVGIVEDENAVVLTVTYPDESPLFTGTKDI